MNFSKVNHVKATLPAGAIRLNHNAAATSALRPLHVSLAILFRAWNYARNANRCPVEFAVEIDRLRAMRLTDCDLRWLVCKGYIEHLYETTLPGTNGRRCRRVGSLKFFDKSCFVLTEKGSSFANQDAHDGHLRLSSNGHLEGKGNTALRGLGVLGQEATPIWDRGERELRAGGSVIKRFCVPAPNQELILTAFQEEGWPKRIDDPLPPTPEMDAKLRLRKAFSCLNRNRRFKLVHFHGDGRGRGVCWRLTPPRLSVISALGT